jgi:hypothetical protein
MPVTFRIDKEAGIVFTVIEGPLDTDELLRELAAMIKHPDFKPGLSGITDLRKSEMDTFTDDVQRVAEFFISHKEQVGVSRSAIILSGFVTYGMTRMFQAFAEESSLDTRIFQDMDEALEWIKSGQDESS